jgi:hypothetical protein
MAGDVVQTAAPPAATPLSEVGGAEDHVEQARRSVMTWAKDAKLVAIIGKTTSRGYIMAGKSWSYFFASESRGWEEMGVEVSASGAIKIFPPVKSLPPQGVLDTWIIGSSQAMALLPSWAILSHETYIMTLTQRIGHATWDIRIGSFGEYFHARVNATTGTVQVLR